MYVGNVLKEAYSIEPQDGNWLRYIEAMLLWFPHSEALHVPPNAPSFDLFRTLHYYMLSALWKNICLQW